MDIIKRIPNILKGFHVTAALIAVLGLGLTVPTANAEPEKSKLTIGIPVLAGTFLPVYLAEDLGLYKNEGLEVKVLAFRGGSA
ncbi:MAG: hypothetical protein HQ503_11810, partial [Rhodospirillales bacterium]|nr:hypothetical protein [Rhodospirillales bacterium]